MSRDSPEMPTYTEPMEPSSKQSSVKPYVFGIGIPLTLIISVTGWMLSSQEVVEEQLTKNPAQTQETPAENEPEEATVEHVPLPDEVRGIYWTVGTAGNNRAQELLSYMKDTGLNTAVIDLKLDNGALAFKPEAESLQQYAQEDPAVEDFPMLLQQLGNENIYRIARIAVMRDTTFARQHPDHAMHRAGGGLWRDNTGAAWVDPASPLVAEYAKTLAREAYAMGFDEVQFDYVRFASDGALSAIRYTQYDQNEPKEDVMKRYFDNMGSLRDEGIPISFDVFGMTFWSASDFNIGQQLEDVYPNADFVSPMVYPSHYPPGFQGFGNPALYPYEIVKRSLDKGAELLETDNFIDQKESRPKFRPWIQDFDIGAVYTAPRIEAQIKAARDANASGWMLWNARNVYQAAVYLPESQ